MNQPNKDIIEKLWKLKELDEQYQELRCELEGWLNDSCDNYLAAWMRSCLERGKRFDLNSLKESLDNPRYYSANSDNICLWHQLNEVKKLIAIYELRANHTLASEA